MIIFKSMFNDTEWRTKQNESKYLQSQVDLETCAREFAPSGHGTLHGGHLVLQHVLTHWKRVSSNANVEMKLFTPTPFEYS